MADILKSSEFVKYNEDILRNNVNNGKYVHIAFVTVGDNPASQVYVRNKIKACERVGFKSTVINLQETVDQDDLDITIKRLNDRSDITGIILQNPIPKHLNAADALCYVDPVKDIDGFGEASMANSFSADYVTSGHFPATAIGIISWLNWMNYEPSGKNVVVIGRSNTVGKPLALLLLSMDATVTICHSKTPNLSKFTKDADLIVCAAGKPNLLTAEDISDDTLIVDVGINKVDGKIVGDCPENIGEGFKNVVKTAVPGGVGPVTVSSLLTNALIHE